MKKIMIGLSLLASLSSYASTSCSLGSKRKLTPAQVQVLESKGYNLVEVNQLQSGDMYLSFEYGSKRSVISGFFCTTQFIDISLIERGDFDKLVHAEKVSSCMARSTFIRNEDKKVARVLRSLPDCQ